MNRKNVSTFLSFAFLIVVICSAIPTTINLQNNKNISDNGTVDYPGLLPTSPNTWNLDITITPANGGTTSIQGTQTIPVGQNTTVSATPNSGYTFNHWLFDGNSSTSNPITIPSQSAGSTHTLDATFNSGNGTVDYPGLLPTSPNLPSSPNRWDLFVQPEGGYAGFRCNGESTPEYWISVANQYAALIPGSSPGGIWIIASSKVLNFDAATDAALTALDGSGVKVYLQPGEEVIGEFNQYPASVDQLIDRVLANYGHHSCVIGIGIDVEQRGETWNDYKGCQVTDAEATSWLNKVKAYNPNFKLFLKHWRPEVLPPTVRNDIVFVNMDQDFSDFNHLKSVFQSWGSYYSSAEVAFQVGYNRDKWWWSTLANPPYEIATAIFQNIPNAEGVYWVNFSVKEVFP